MKELRFDGKVAIVTGAGGGLGRAYAILLASRGCGVVVNDLGGSRSGEGASKRAADHVVDEIVKAGGKAVANYDSVENGDAIVKQTIQVFGRLDILINNAGILRDRSFDKMSADDWNLVMKVHLNGSFACTKAAWPIFQAQGYGRIVMTSSAAGLYGNYGQANYGAAKMALVGFSNSISKEGAKKNIYCNVVAPVAGSRITETVLPADILAQIRPEYVAPFVAWMCHEECGENGSVYEVGAGFAAKVRWERGEGALLKVNDASFTPSAIAASLSKAMSFDDSQKRVHPTNMAQTPWIDLVKSSMAMQAPNPQTNGPPLHLANKVAVVTGAGGGLGKEYCLLFARLGATVVVNDFNEAAATAVVSEIKKAGGNASADCHSVVLDASKIIKNCIEKYGQIDILVNNAGILRDKAFKNMTAQQWADVMSVHLMGTMACTQAAWPHMRKQAGGHVIMTSSAVGLYGNFGQANYSAAKAGIIGLALALSKEGQKHGIYVNVIAPNAGTAMTATIFDQQTVDLLKPAYVAPLVGYLAHPQCKLSGCIFEVGSGWFAKVRQQQAGGYQIVPDNLSLEEIARKWPRFSDFSNAKYPGSAQESFSMIMSKVASKQGASKPNRAASTKDASSSSFSYTNKDIILYNLGVGCAADELPFVYEASPAFSAIPTFAVIPAFVVMMDTKMDDLVDGFNPALLLHGEHYCEIVGDGLPPAPPGLATTKDEKITLESKRSIVKVVQKGQNALVVIRIETFAALNNQKKLVCINEGTIFLRSVRVKKPIDGKSSSHPQTACMKSTSGLDASTSKLSMKRPADFEITQKIPENQAALYRLSGDLNPLHIDTSFAKVAGFPKPILHGLCSFGHAARHVVVSVCGGDASRLKAIRARFTRHVFPGETLKTEMWDLGNGRIAVQMKVVERNEIVLANCIACIRTDAAPKPSGLKADSRTSVAKETFDKFVAVYARLPEALKKDQIKKVNGIFEFTIKAPSNNADPPAATKHFIDLKSGMGQIGHGKSPTKPDIVIGVDEDTFIALVAGTISGQQAFMKGKVKIEGNMMLAMKLDRVLKTLASEVPASKL